MLPAPTQRLQFRMMAEADADLVGEALEVTSPSSAYHGRDPLAWVAWNRRSHDEHGFCLWVLETHEGRFVGDCGLTVQHVEGEALVEIGWHVLPALRGRGYAPEAATSVLAAAGAAGIAHVIALIRPENAASQRVAGKVGLRVEREAVAHGRPTLVLGVDLG